MEPRKSSRRLNFISGEDFYFLAYSTLLVLHQLGGGRKRVKDHRKIAVLIQFITDSRLAELLERTQGRASLNPVDRELLFLSFTNAELHKREIFKILFSLEKRGLVSLSKTEVAEVLEVELRSKDMPDGFFDDQLFALERENAGRIRQVFPRIAALSFETLVDRIYVDRGVRVWVS